MLILVKKITVNLRYLKFRKPKNFMKTNFLRRSAIAALTLTTASFYFAQEETQGSEKNIDEVVLVGVADIAKDRKTPVAVSTIKEGAIVEKIGNQEFPEVLNSTPSVYATKAGGGFGDSKINIRGFQNENIAVMVNGMPVNDMEGGKVYWSNWAGISDVTSALQVQRGLGASKLAIASVGGTINIITRAADKKKQGTVTIGVGNDGYHKALFSYNTGKSKSGWSTSFLLSRTAGAMYAHGTDFEAYSYFFALGFQPNKKHDFQFMVTGAPQVHDQRYSQVSIDDYIKYGNGVDKPNRKYNPLRGYLNGREMVWARNFYHKPVAMFNWDWNINEKNKLATVFYASLGRGGGTGASPLVARNFNNYRTADGLLDYDKMVADNMANPTSPKILRAASTNEHDWYGFLTSFTHKFNSNWQLSAGLDGRYYKGYHYRVITDMLGANSYTDASNKNIGNRIITSTHNIQVPWNPFNKISAEHIAYDNDGEVLWGGVFGQVEYSNDKLSAFLQGAISEQGYQRIDHFLLPGTLAVAGNSNSKMDVKTGFKYLFGFNIKGGLNYNINENHNIFTNIGYYEKQPFMNAVYANNRNYLNQNLTNEKIFGMELGYSFRSSVFNANVNLYRTSWKDRYVPITNRFKSYDYSATPGADGKYPELSGQEIQGRASVYGVQEIHEGVELDAEYKLSNLLSVTGAFSFGDWYYKGKASASYFTDNNEVIYDEYKKPIENVTLYLSDVKVGDAAQLTTNLGLKVRPVKGLSLNADWRYVDHLYASVSPQNFREANHNGSLRLPSYNLLDVGLSYKLSIGNNQSFTFRGNVYNVLDTTYIAESKTNIHAGAGSKTYKGIATTNEVYFGYGRTWSASVTFNF